MNVRIIIASIIIIAAIIFAASSFLESNIEYGTFDKAMETSKKIQVKGEWVREEYSGFDIQNSEFHFSMKDENGKMLPVVYKGSKPNNFEIAKSIVVKGKYTDGSFYATEILTKCPSKYEAETSSTTK
jgi:cytochrome c-type biogenesis protein CcmE